MIMTGEYFLFFITTPDVHQMHAYTSDHDKYTDISF